jgi:uncharacterized RDD family membrane protein YckC
MREPKYSIDERSRRREISMPACRECGKEVPEGAQYCPNCGAPVQTPLQPRLAFWGERFLAWLVDIIILGIATGLISLLTWAPNLPTWFPFVNFGFSNIVYFLYWTLMEGIYGRSLGKMLMRIKVTRSDGQPIDLAQAALESVGKAFLLPIDLILGWILHPRKRQRIFNYLSGTIVLRAKNV